MMKVITTLILLSLFPFAFSQDWAKKRLEQSPRHQEWVDVKHGNRTVRCFVVYPERKEKTPAVIVIHEIMGLTDWVMSVADQLAENGYIAIAPDLLSGMAPGGGRTIDFPDVNKVREAISALPQAQITSDLNAVSDYVKKLPSCNGKIAVAGFCWGGRSRFFLRPNVLTFLPLLSFMAQDRKTKVQSREYDVLFMVFTVKTTTVSTQRFPKPKRK